MDRLVEIIMNTSSYFSWRIKYQAFIIWHRASKVGTWFVCNACALGPHSIGVYLANETCYQWHDSSQICQGKVISKPVLLLCQHPFSLLSFWTWAYCWSVSEDLQCIRVASERTYKRMRSISTNMLKATACGKAHATSISCLPLAAIVWSLDCWDGVSGTQNRLGSCGIIVLQFSCGITFVFCEISTLMTGSETKQ